MAAVTVGTVDRGARRADTARPAQDLTLGRPGRGHPRPRRPLRPRVPTRQPAVPAGPPTRPPPSTSTSPSRSTSRATSSTTSSSTSRKGITS